MERGIVIHAASYVDPSLVAVQGRIGRSQGCFAVNPRVIAQVLEQLGPGRLLFVDELSGLSSASSAIRRHRHTTSIALV